MGDTSITYNKFPVGMNDSKSYQSSEFESAWCDFYEKVKSWAVSSSQSDSSDSEYVVVEDEKTKEVGLKWLENIHKLLFGQNEEQKAYATTYGMGVLELILKVYYRCESSNRTDEELLLATLKALKSCVLKNPTARRRCRRAQVMALLENVLKGCNSQKVIEEDFTLLAATCMNDDINSWQASEELKGYIELLASSYSSSQTVQQMSSYLLSLFKTVSSSLQVPHAKFFHNLAQAENISFEGDAALDNKQYGFAETKYNSAFNLATNYSSANPVIIHTFLAQLLSKRGICRIETGYVESALEDAKLALDYNNVIGTRLQIMALAKSDRANMIADEVPSFNTILLQPPDDDRILDKLWSGFVQSNQELFNLS